MYQQATLVHVSFLLISPTNSIPPVKRSSEIIIELVKQPIRFQYFQLLTASRIDCVNGEGSSEINCPHLLWRGALTAKTPTLTFHAFRYSSKG